MDIGDSIGAIIGALMLSLLIAIVIFMLLREVVCWYAKINARMHELQQINQNLSEIRALLIQGNTVGAVTAGQVTDMAQTSATTASTVIYNDDIPEL
jgi:hypothetical protein